MAKTLKVYGGCYDGRNRLIVATYTKKAAYEAMSEIAYFGSYATWDSYGSETGNNAEVEHATAYPGVVFSRNVNSTINKWVIKEKRITNGS